MNVLAASLIVRLKFGPKIGLRTLPNGLYATFLRGDLNATLDLVSEDTEWIARPGIKAGNSALYSLDACVHVCEQVNKHVAHKADREITRTFVEWDMARKDLEDAREAIDRAAVALERDIPQICIRAEIIPVYQGEVLQDLRQKIMPSAQTE